MKTTLPLLMLFAAGCSTPSKVVERIDWHEQADHVKVGMTRAEVERYLPVNHPQFNTSFSTGTATSVAYRLDAYWTVNMRYLHGPPETLLTIPVLYYSDLSKGHRLLPHPFPVGEYKKRMSKAVDLRFKAFKKGSSYLIYKGQYHYDRDFRRLMRVDLDEFYEAIFDKARTDPRRPYLLSYIFMWAVETGVQSPVVKNTALEGLNDGVTPSRNYLLTRSIQWCLKHKDQLSDEQVAKAEIALRAVIKLNPKSMIRTFEETATGADIPFIKEIYKKEGFDKETIGACQNVFLGSNITKGRLLSLLVKLSDEEAVETLAGAITQNKDVYKRAWGIHVAMYSENRELIPQLVAALQDKRVIDDNIMMQFFDYRGPESSLWANTRVCDASFRALYALSAKATRDAWPLKMPPSLQPHYDRSWKTYTASEYPYSKAVPDKESPGWTFKTVGFTDGQLDAVRNLFEKDEGTSLRKRHAQRQTK